jgi:hypothetical protein
VGKQQKPTKKLQEVEEFYKAQMLKQDMQMEKAETKLFSRCVFYILGFCGRGKESRFNMVKVIEKNGGRAVLFMNGQVTHVVTRGVCHRKKAMLEESVESRKLVIVAPEWVEECVKAQRLLAVDRFQSVTWKKNSIENYAVPESAVQSADPG